MKRLCFFLCLIFAVIATSAQDKQKYDIVVALDGTGNFTSIQEAVNSVRGVMTERKSIYIKNGIYNEKIVVPTHVMNITLIGEDKFKTVITWADHANMLLSGTDKKMGTFKTYTMLVQGSGFHAENLTIENNAPQLGQAVALHVEGDKAVFTNCRILGNQDTIYAGNESSRQLYKNCYIDGTTDFIFGSATVFFDNCHIHCKKDSYITAPSTPQSKKYGFVFSECTISADSTILKVYLGRPWRPYGSSVFVKCNLTKSILAAGWDNWRNVENEKTARFYECLNTGDGAWKEGRVAWAKNLPKKAAKEYTLEKVLAGCDNWNPLKD